MTKYLLTGDDKDCYGCRACEQICPHHAISIKPNKEGFLYPVLEATKCVNCGLCVKVCPIENVSETNTPIAVYAAQFKNEEELLESSSGGVFSALAEYILSKNGYVAGCIYMKPPSMKLCAEMEIYHLQVSCHYKEKQYI